MSTKIYNGRRLRAGTDVFAFVRQLRKTMMPVRERLDAEMVINRAVVIHDAALAGTPIKDGHSSISTAVTDYFEEQRKADPQMRDHDPHRFETSFGVDPETGRVMALPFCEHNDFMTVFGEMPEIEGYGYWNNTDPEEGVSRAEWTQRRKAWDRVMTTGIPGDSMLSFRLCGSPTLSVMSLFNVHQDATPTAVLAAAEKVRSREDRAATIVRGRVSSLGVLPFDGSNIMHYLRVLDDHAARVAPQIQDQLPEIRLDRLHANNIAPVIDTATLDELIHAGI